MLSLIKFNHHAGEPETGSVAYPGGLTNPPEVHTNERESMHVTVPRFTGPRTNIPIQRPTSAVTLATPLHPITKTVGKGYGGIYHG